MADVRTFGRRGIGVIVATLLAAALAASVAPAHSASSFTKAKAKRLFFTKNKTKDLFFTREEATTRFGVIATGNTQDNGIDFLEPDFAPIISTQITAPTNGVLYVAGTLSGEDSNAFAGSGDLAFRLSVDGTEVTDVDLAYGIQFEEGAPDRSSGAVNAVVSVDAGPHTVALEGRDVTGSFLRGRSVTAIFVPSGSGVTIPA